MFKLKREWPQFLGVPCSFPELCSPACDKPCGHRGWLSKGRGPCTDTTWPTKTVTKISLSHIHIIFSPLPSYTQTGLLQALKYICIYFKNFFLVPTSSALLLVFLPLLNVTRNRFHVFTTPHHPTPRPCFSALSTPDDAARSESQMNFLNF